MLNKYRNLCETNDPIHFKEKIDLKYLNVNEIKKRVENGDDIIGRHDKFNKIEIDDTYPNYITQNLKFFVDWIEK